VKQNGVLILDYPMVPVTGKWGIHKNKMGVLKWRSLNALATAKNDANLPYEIN
jgi:hypothetical protein